jgi:Ca-activated chloride channel homolog
MIRRFLVSVLACAALSVGLSRGARGDGLIVVSTPTTVVPGHFAFAPLQVQYHKVEATIKDQVAETFVDQKFYNPNGQVLEGDYIFPVPAGAQLNNFTMDIDGKQVAAELLPADKARAIYTEIVRKTRDPALLEYAGRDMFRVHIFPIPANGTKQITLKYTELLKQDNGLWDYHYTLNTEKFSSKPLENVSLKVTVDCSEPITTLYSPTHEIDKVLKGDKSATVGFEGKNIRPDTDFHLFIGHKTSPVGINLLSYRPDKDKEGYFVLLAAPTLSKDLKPMPKDVVFVMDTSGSMAGEKIEQARTALKYCIDTLNPQDRFDIMRFSTEAEPLFNGLKDATADNRKKAVEFSAGLRAAGGTAIDEAITKALEEKDAKAGSGDRMFMLVFMTDGQPTVGEQNIDTILKHEQAAAKGATVRVFTFGVGTDVNTKLLDLMASQTRGYSQYVLPQEKLEVSMSNFWGKVQDPVIAGIKVDTGNVALSKVYPKDMPDLFKGDQLVVFGSYEKPGKGAVTLSGMVNGVQQKFAQDVTFEDKTDTSKEWIAKLWATRRVGYLLDEIRLHGESKELKDEVVDLARKWGVVTPYTAMLIIEDERARGVPLAQRSLREMEYDTRVAMNTAGASYSMKAGEVAGSSQAIANGINTTALKNSSSLDMARQVAGQDADRLQVANAGGGSALYKNQSAPSAAAKPNDMVGGPIIAGNIGPGAPGAYGGATGGMAGGFGGGMGGGAGRGGRGGGMGGFGGAAGAPAASPTVIGGGANMNGTLLPAPVAAAATAPVVRQSELNLGNQSANGWQTAADGKADGYRVVNNYAQQTRTINNRSFFLNGNQWTDANVQNAAKTTAHVKVVFGSDAYFDLLAKHPEAAEYLALGNNLTIELGGKIYDIVEEDAVTK